MKIKDRPDENKINKFIPDENEMRSSWDNFEKFKDEYPEPDITSIWNNISLKLGWNKLQRKFQFRKYYLRYAAAILFPLLGITYGIYTTLKKANDNKNFISYNAPSGMRSKIDLSDGSTIWLQPNSQIKYPKKFNTESREVTFTGQAYFKIHTNPESPFIVHTNKIAVHVLGTQFYIKSKPNDNFIEAGLISGKITITGENIEEQLSPNEIATFSIDQKKISVSKSLDANTHQWNNGSIVFDNCSLGNVLHDISEWYDFNLEIDAGVDVNKQITLTIKEESISEIMKIIKIIAPFNYKIYEDRIKITSIN